MKHIFLSLIALLATLSMVSCQQEDWESNVGYLRIEVGTNAYVDTKAIPENYNPQQIAVQIVNSKGEVVESTDDWETLKGTQLRLAPGQYTVNASSNGFDGSESGFDVPYYAGSQQITVETGKEVTANITCTLANVKVTVNYDDSFQKFASATTTVSSALEGVAALDFVMGSELKPGYFPVGDLTVTVNVTNQAGEQHSQSTSIADVKARKHYILNFKVADAGSIEKPTISINGEEIIFTFTFDVSTEASTQLEVQPANAWSNFAYLEGGVLSSEGELDPAAMRFEYKTADAEEWQTCSATYESESQKYTATLTELTPATEYNYRLVYEKDGNAYASDIVTFITETATTLHNGNMDTWTQSGNTWYPGSSEEAGNTTCFWNTSNPGTSQGMGAIGGAVNPTQGVSSPVHTPDGKAAELKSTQKMSVFAAASLYTGSFLGLDGMSANMEFGKPFTSRPSTLHGFYKYTPGVIDKLDRTPEGISITQGETMDQCAIFIALATKSFQFNNKNEEQYIDYANDPAIIAYGELPSGIATSGDNYVEFNIPLIYRDLITKPTHIIIVCSASKYGDYMTGSTSSVMYIDDLELIYGQPTTAQE
ncbi:DUF4493 domain-containing protein [Mediterranea massiliensis]|uniref:DUF4493 domain-containing protein n=1 Tax=Mediterranea massiliensis TaxID=1841865 RepID=A0ABS2DX07_9BACT|nr:DUF4493 domain-containing protein [Mediterranea massiliensis]MBM6734043.1 DUF4493 domain-containing protein [Mediterranea massiliensis]